MNKLIKVVDWIGRIEIIQKYFNSLMEKLNIDLSGKRKEQWEKTVKEYKDKGYSQKEAELEALNDLGYLDFDEYCSIKNAM